MDCRHELALHLQNSFKTFRANTTKNMTMYVVLIKPEKSKTRQEQTELRQNDSMTSVRCKRARKR